MTQEVKTVYLAGKITGDNYYWSKFNEAERELEAAGFVVLNPAMLPGKGFTYEAYMRMSSAMLDECDAVCFLPDWVESKGAMYEFGRATARGIEVFFYEGWKKSVEFLRELEKQVEEQVRENKATEVVDRERVDASALQHATQAG